MNLTYLVVSPIGTNCYIVYDKAEKAAVVIDPGDSPDEILSLLSDLGVELKGLLFTHGHFDHVGASSALIAMTGARAWIHKADIGMPFHLKNGLTYTDTYDEGDVLELGPFRFTVLHTPGHSPGSVCLLCGSWLFSGDTLFAGSCGRTDLWGGSWHEMMASLRRLAALPGQWAVYPGHGEFTTLARERQTNPYLRIDN